MQGKYSPTVFTAYSTCQNWFNTYSCGKIYDKDGFDSYGYDKNDIDRAGNHENDYALDDELFEYVENSWLFDGSKPVLR